MQQSAAGKIDASGTSGGSVQIDAAQNISVEGSVSAAANAAPGRSAFAGQGGSITLLAGNDVTLDNASLEATGSAAGGRISIQGGGQTPASAAAAASPTVALQGNTRVDASSTRGRGGEVTLTADRVGLFDATLIDASGAIGGGSVLVGGGFHGADASIADALQTVMAKTASIDASATQSGTGGHVALWSDGQTSFAGTIEARGGAAAGAGGFVEVSSKGTLNFLGNVDASAPHGAAGTLLLDPQNIDVISGGSATLTANELAFATNIGGTSNIDPNTITVLTNAGTAVTLQANTDLTISSAIITSGGSTGGALTFQAGRSIAVNASVISNNGSIIFSANDATATGSDRVSGPATFANSSVIDAGTGSVSITMGTFAGVSGGISAGHISAGSLSITQNGPTGGAANGAIDLGETDLTGNLAINADTATNVTNLLGGQGASGAVIVRGTATISVGTGSVTINGPNTDFSIIGLTAGNVWLNDTNAMQFGTSVISGNLTETTIGPIAYTGSVQVTGLATLTANYGGFGYADPYINLQNPANHFAGGLVLDVPSTGATGTGGYAIIRDSGALTVNQSTNASYLNITAGDAVTLGATGATSAGSSISVSTSTGNITTIGAVTAGSTATYTTSSGAVTTGSTNAADLYVTGTGAVSLGASSIGQDLSVTTNAPISDTGAISVGRQTTLTAGSANNITLSQADSFSSMRIVSADNVTLVAGNGINFGAYCGCGGFTSNISGNLILTAGGNITQTGQSGGDGYSAITVAGTTLFNASNASSQIGLYLGSSNPFNGGSPGESNLFTGGVTLARVGSGLGFNLVDIRDTNPSAVVLAGLTTVGTLSNVSLRYDNAPSIALPGMTVTGALDVYGPSVANTGTTPANVISQTGPIVVNGYVIMAAASTGDIVLTNAANDFPSFGIANTGARNLTIVNNGPLQLYAQGQFNEYITGNLSVTANGAITDANNAWGVSGTAYLNAGATNNINFQQNDTWGGAVSLIGDNVIFNPQTSLILGNSNIAGTLSITARNYGYALTQLPGSAVVMSNTGATTTFNNFSSGITLAQPNNVFGPLAISQVGAVNIAENSAITQASAWGDYNNNVYPLTLTTTNSQAITLTQPSPYMGNLTITQANAAASSPGAVTVTSTADTAGITQGSGAASAWTTYGTVTLNSGAYSINLNNPNNVFGPLQVSGATGSYLSVPSSVTLYAEGTATTTAITDVGGTGAWAVGSSGTTGSGVVKLVAYDTTGTTPGGGSIVLDNTGNVLGNLYLKATNATITENASITDGPLLSNWDGSGAGDSGWSVSGAVDLIVNNPTGKTITLANTTNLIAPMGISTTGSGTLTSVLITDNENLAQSSIWNIGAAPITLNATSHQINLSGYGNVLGNISISNANGTPTSVAITENNPITQGATAWSLNGVSIALVAQSGNSITLTDAANVMGNLALIGGAVSITENAPITQAATAGGAWATTGTTTLDVSASAGSGITLTNASNVLGPIAVAGTPSAVNITENAAITQASAWVQPTTPITLNSGSHDVVLSQAGNQLGALTITAQDAVVTEANSAGITEAGAWTVPGTTTLTAGAANPIVLTSIPANSFGTVSIVSASNATIDAIGPVIFDASTIASGGTLTVSAGGAITQSGAITAPSLQLIGTGNATLTDSSNNVGNLAAGFSGGDLSFTNSGSFAVAVVGGTSGVTIGNNNVTLTSVNGTITGLSNVNASSSSLTLTTGTALSLPQISIAGPQTYTASTVSGTGITLNTNINSTAAGAINFDSPVTLAADLTVQSTNSAINFASTLAGGTYQLNVNAGTGLVNFNGAVSALGKTTDASAALTLASGGANFADTVSANNGLAITGPVVFTNTVTLGDGSAASVFTGLVTLGNIGGMNLSGYNGMSFDAGVLLESGPATINSNNSPLNFQTAGSVSGPYGLTLNSGTAALIGLNRMGSNLTSLTVTALNPTIPAGGVSIAGPQNYTSTSGSSITLDGNVISTMAGTITFNGPVTVGAASTVASSNSNIVFAGTADGNNNLTVNPGTGTASFAGAVGSIAPLGSGTGAALVLQGTGATTFDGTVQARSGMSATGPVTFDANVTLTNGDTGSTFTGLVTTGGSTGNTISGFGGIAFNGGLTLAGGPISVVSNGSTLSFGGPVTGAEDLTLNALAGGAGTVTGLAEIGFASNLTALNVTAQTLSLPGTGLAVAGPMSFTAAGGITANGAVGNLSGPATAAVSFNGPVTLATGPVAVTTNNAAVNFASTVNGAEALSVNFGTGTATFSAAVGGTTPLASLTAGGATVIDGGIVHTSGAQSYDAAVTLGANTALTGNDVQFGGTLDGPYTLIVNDAGTTSFGGIVGGATPLTSLTVTAANGIAMNPTAVTTVAAQIYNGAMTLGGNLTATATGITFGGTVDGNYNLIVNPGAGATTFAGAIGSIAPLGTGTGAALVLNGLTATTFDSTLQGLSGITATGPVTFDNNVTLTNGNTGSTFTGLVTTGGSSGNTISGFGGIAFNSGLTLVGGPVSVLSNGSTLSLGGPVTGAEDLTLNALAGGAGMVTGLAEIGFTSNLTALNVTAQTLSLPSAGLAVAGPMSFTAPGGITVNGAVGNLSGPATAAVSFNGPVTLATGAITVTTNNESVNFSSIVNGAEALTVNAGTGTTTFSGAVGGGTPLTSLHMNPGDPTDILGGSIHTSGAQIYGDAVLLGAGTTLTGNGVQFVGTIDGPYTLIVNDAGTTSFGGIIGGATPLTSLTVTAANGIAMNPTAVTTTAAQIYNGVMTLGGNLTATGVGITFGGTVDGAHTLTVDATTGTASFAGAVGSIAPLGSGTGAALVLQGTGATTFDGTVQARSGMSATGPVTFDANVTLTNGDTGSTFTGLVTTGGSTGNTISGFGGIAFNGGLTLAGGPISVVSNGSTLSFGGPVTGAEDLTLNALAGGAGTVTGLAEIGFASNLTALNVTAQTLSLPGTGLAVAGPMSFTAAGGITANGAVGNLSGPATAAVSFNGPVTLATGPVAVTTNNAAVNFASTVNGAEALSVNFGTGTATFSAAVGGTTPLASLTAGGATVIDGGIVHTSGAQSYDAAVTLGANTALTGNDVQFGGTLDGPYTLIVNDAGTTSFGGIVGGATPLTSLTVTAANGIAMNPTAVTTVAAQIYNGAMTLGGNLTATATGITFGGTVDGTGNLTANATSGVLRFNGAVGSATPLTTLNATGNTISATGVTTSGAQAFTAQGGFTLGGNLATTGSNITVTGPTTLGAGVTLSTGTGTGNILFSGSTSTIDGAQSLTLAAGDGNVTLGGVVGGNTKLTAVTLSGNNLTLPDIFTVGDANQTYTALDNITLTQSRTLSAPISFTADADNNGTGSFILLDGVSLTASNSTLTIRAADIDLEGSSTLASGTGLMTLIASADGNITLGGTTDTGPMTITGSELQRMSSSGGLDLETTGSGSITVNGVTQTQSQNITGTLSLLAQGSGNVNFVAAPSAFNALTVNAAGGTTSVGVDLTARNSAITFVTPVAVSGASTISSQGGNISFESTLAVNNNLTLSTSNGVLTFGGAVGSNQTLTLNLGGGSVSAASLGELQSTLTGLTVNGSSGITLPALTINGPQAYDTGTITATGDLGGVGLAFNNVLIVTPAVGNSLALNAGTGTLGFSTLVSFGTTNMTLTADQINFAGAVTGSGSLAMQPFTMSRDVAVGGSGAPIMGLNLTAADLAWLPIGTLSSLTIGSASGSGTLDVAGPLNAPGTPLTLNGGGGITQTGGSVGSGPLTLYAAGNAITLANGTNAFGAVAINGAPSAVSLVNTQDIGQQGTAAWNLGPAPVTLNAGTHNITLNNAGNTFGTLVLNGGNVQVTEAAATDIGASSIAQNLTVTSSGGINVSGALGVTGNVSLTSAGEVTQSAPLTIGGNFNVITTANAGDVTFNNSGAAATTIGNTLVGGNYVLTATNEAISQAPGTSLQVVGNVTVTGASIVLNGTGNLVGGTTTLPASNTSEFSAAGVITLGVGVPGNTAYSGNLTVISEATNRSFGSAQVSGAAILLDDASNSISGTVSMSASPPTIQNTGFVQTGIVQAAGTSLSVAGLASFTAEASSAGSLGINLTNAGNSFGTILLSGNTVNVTNSSAGLTTIGGALATTGLTLTAAGGVAQSGSIQTPALAITAAGPVTLTNAANDVNTFAAVSGGNAISYVNSTNLAVAGINAGGANVSLTAGGAGSLTQTAALLNVGTLTANAGGAITLISPGNSIATLAAATAGTGIQIYDANDLSVSGAVLSTTGDLTVRAAGNLTLAAGGSLDAAAGNVVASTEGAGNFINDSAAAGSALGVGSGDRWLVYSDTPDLISGSHTVKGGLTSSFRYYNATYTTYAPGSVTESGNGFIYDYATPALTVAAAILGTPSQVYGSPPTASLGYTLTGFVDSEDSALNAVAGTATYSTALSSAMNAGIYSITYTSGLTSANYTLAASTTGAAYTVTPAIINLSATRAYDAATDAAASIFGAAGTVSGVNGQNLILSGSGTLSAKNVGSENVSSLGTLSLSNGTGLAGNYTLVGGTDTVTVTAATLTYSANAASQSYGTTPSGLSGTVSGFVGGDTLGSATTGSAAFSTTATAASNVGQFAITGSGLTADNGNYNFVQAAGNATALTINPAIVSLTGTRSYDAGTDAAASIFGAAGTVSGVNGQNLILSGTGTLASKNVGSENVSALGTLGLANGTGLAGNYTLIGGTDTVTVTAATLTYSANAASQSYGTTPSGLSGTVSGFVGGDTLGSATTGSAAFSTTATAASNVGQYAIAGSGLTADNGNYNFIQGPGNNAALTINPAIVSLTGTRSYDAGTDAAASIFGAAGTVSGVNGQNLILAGNGTLSAKNVGSENVSALGTLGLANGTGLAGNYTLIGGTDTVTVTAATLTYSATAASQSYGATPSVSGTVSGFVGGDTLGSATTGSAAFSTTATAASNVGQYGITGGGLTADNGNYTFIQGPGNATALTINPAIVSLTGTRPYDAATDAAATLFGAAGTMSGVDGQNLILSGSGTLAAKNAGSENVSALGTLSLGNGTGLASNYTLVGGTDTVTVTAATLTYTATAASQSYGATPAGLTGSVSGFVGGDTLGSATTGSAAFSTTATAASNVGQYAITGGGLTADNANYTFIQGPGNATALTINKAIVSLTGTRPYDAATDAAAIIFGAAGTVSGVNGQNLILNGGGTLSAKNAGSESVSALGTLGLANGTGLASNYTLVGGTDAVAVTPATLTYTATAASQSYGATPSVSGTVSGFVGGDTLGSATTGSATFSTIATAASNVGQYAITGSGLTADNGNYNFIQGPGNNTALTINPVNLTITANNLVETYNATVFGGGNSVSYSGFVNGQSAATLGGTLTYGGNSQGARNAGSYSITPGGLTDGNYAIFYVNGTLTIGKANLTLTTGNVAKTYDGALDASGTIVTTGGTQIFGSDTLSGGTFAFSNANAGASDKTVTVGGVTVSDGNGGNNYNVTYVANTTSTINPAGLTVDTSNVTKTYNGTLNANGTLTVVSGTLYHNVSNGGAQDSLSGGTFAFTDPNAGSGNKSVTTSGVTVTDGNGGGNYLLSYAVNTASTINPAPLSYAATIVEKPYDGTTLATLSGYTLTGFVGSQTVDAAASAANFSDPNAGSGKAVTIGGIMLANGTNSAGSPPTIR